MYVLLFFACSFLGWCMEVTCKLVQFGHFINRGFLLGPLCPIYGTGAVLMAYFLPLWTTQVESTFLLALVLCGTRMSLSLTSAPTTPTPAFRPTPPSSPSLFPR